jgi:hypothetical protein
MSETNWSARIVPYGADQTLYVVVDGFGGTGAARQEIDVERTNLESTIYDLMSGRFTDPVRVIAYNTLEHWARDVSAEVAFEIQSRCDMDGNDLPEHIKDFVERHTRRLPRTAAVIPLSARSAAHSRS